MTDTLTLDEFPGRERCTRNLMPVVHIARRLLTIQVRRLCVTVHPSFPHHVMSSPLVELVSSADLALLREAMVAEDEQRESLIKRSREVLKLSKNAIYALHRGEVAKAGEMVSTATELARRDLLPLVANAPALRSGALSAALEELAEASIFAGFLSTGRVPTIEQCAGGIVNRDEYLGGVSRRRVARAQPSFRAG